MIYSLWGGKGIILDCIIRLCVTYPSSFLFLYLQNSSLLISVWAHFESYKHCRSLFRLSTLLLSLTCISLSRHIHTLNPCTYVYKHTLTTPTCNRLILTHFCLLIVFPLNTGERVNRIVYVTVTSILFFKSQLSHGLLTFGG